MRCARTLVLGLALAASPAGADNLPRARPAELHPGLRVEYGSLPVADGVRLRTILTRPEVARRPPVILFVQWLSCDSIELDPDDDGGWTQMLRGVVRRSGWAVMRTEKRGVGDSEGGPCSSLDYETELADHAAALASLRQRSDVDTRRIVVFGASMGSRMAPEVGAGVPGVVGIMTWGGGSKTWFERMLAFDRHALELGGTAPADVTSRMKAQTRFHVQYLIEGRNPDAIIAADPPLAGVWSGIVGTAADSHYGRPFAFHQQAQRADWAAAWGRVTVPALVVMGAFDWFENTEGHETSVRAANRNEPGLARLEIIPRMDHHFTLFDSAEAAFRGQGGRADAGPFLRLALPWLGARAATADADAEG
jgi:dienelactone hydrolase